MNYVNLLSTLVRIINRLLPLALMFDRRLEHIPGRSVRFYRVSPLGRRVDVYAPILDGWALAAFLIVAALLLVLSPLVMLLVFLIP